MNKKKIREAIEVIKGYKRLDEYMNNVERIPYCDLAIEALEKQIPKKLVRNIFDRDSKICCCGNSIDIDDEFEFCSYCGQRLDWSE